MTPIIHAIEEINDIIPEEILVEAFGSKSKGMRRDNVPVNVEYAIREQVINKRVIKSLNLQSQRTITIEHRKLSYVKRGVADAVIRVSKKDIGGASIVTPLALMYADAPGHFNTANYATDSARTQTEGRFQRVANGHLNIDNVQTSDLRLIAPNTVFVENFAIAERCSLLCTVTHDPELMSLPSGYWDDFAQLCCLATEAYAYRKLRTKVDRAKLAGGMELGSFREILDEYKDSEKMYKEHLKKFRKYDNLGNAKNRQRATKAQGPAYHM